MKKIFTRVFLCLLYGNSIISFDENYKSSHDNTMENGLFFQLAGSYNSISFDQYLYASGISNIYSEGVLVAFGEAGGPANPYHNTQSIFAPVIQLGYAHRLFEDGDWSLGFKLSYKHLGLTFVKDVIDSPQFGSFTTTDAVPVDSTFSGHVIIGSSQNTINNELSLLAFATYAIADNYSVYMGASPIVVGLSSNLYQVIGFAYLDSAVTDITGTPTNIFNNIWMWGGAGEIGMNYYFNSRWSCNISYNYGITGTSTINDSGLFASATDGYTDSGTLYTTTTQRAIIQSVGFSVTMIF